MFADLRKASLLGMIPWYFIEMHKGRRSINLLINNRMIKKMMAMTMIKHYDDHHDSHSNSDSNFTAIHYLILIPRTILLIKYLQLILLNTSVDSFLFHRISLNHKCFFSFISVSLHYISLFQMHNKL